ncbi:MAG TPA: FKBP-type peptidyl-prolyl cis-trans isomerase [Acidimicrobiia bacterium]|nr:FKBP-type peptidyl-prolyl cis-trans isomerase [Acidimicrobiia bacterium]
MRTRAAALFLVISAVLTAGLGAAAVVALPAGAATGLDGVTVSTDTTVKPTVKFDKPFAIKKTADSVVAAGTGQALAAAQSITFDYVLVDGRTGKEVQTSYGRTSASMVLDPAKTNVQLVTSLTGKTVGSRVLVGIAAKDGLAKRLKSKAVKKDDTLLFVIDVKSVRTPLAKATGEPLAPVAGLPTVMVAADGKPTITIPSGVAAPTTLGSQVLIKGTGPVVEAGQTVSVHYTSVIYDGGKQLDSSWDRGTPVDAVIGKGQVIAGWDEGLVGQTVGSQVLLVLPPDKAYGTQGEASGGIKGTDTLVFVIDILDAY